MYLFLINLLFLISLVFFFQRIRHGLHILQLENYYNDRYIVWINKNVKKAFDLKLIILLVIASVLYFLNKNLAVVCMIIIYLISVFSFKKSKEKKPFVYTARIKRMFITLFIIMAIICAFLNTNNYGVIVLNCLAICAYLIVYLVNFINRPIEKCIRGKFCKKASKKLKSNNLKIIGITGSYGKTSTKYAVNTILSQKYNSLMTPESYNTTMGVVRTVNEKLNSTHNLFVCEMGAKYVGDIKEICDIVSPDYAIITAIGPQHLDTFKSLENVRKTKLELVDSLPEDGIAFVNWEDENIRHSNFTRKIIKFGLSSDADYYAQNIEITEFGSSFDVVIPGKGIISIKTKLLGKLNILNIVGAVAVADKLGLSENEIKMGVKYLRPVEHRLELKQNANGSIIIDDAYNSNVKGASMALEVLKNFQNRKRILITPGIVELGDKMYEINKNLGAQASESADFVILVGKKQAEPIYDGLKEKKYNEEKIYIAENLNDGINKMNEIITANSVILLENDLPDNYL